MSENATSRCRLLKNTGKRSEGPGRLICSRCLSREFCSNVTGHYTRKSLSALMISRATLSQMHVREFCFFCSLVPSIPANLSHLRKRSCYSYRSPDVSIMGAPTKTNPWPTTNLFFPVLCRFQNFLMQYVHEICDFMEICLALTSSIIFLMSFD